MARRAFKTINKKDFDKLIYIEQLMFTKTFFLKNISKIKKLAYNEEVDIITEKNTVFVSIPLIRVEKINQVKYKSIRNAFRMKFLDKLYSLKYQKKFYSLYPYKLILQGLFGKAFILKCLKETLNPENIKKLKDN